jgi:hypothetical protein
LASDRGRITFTTQALNEKFSYLNLNGMFVASYVQDD